MKVLEKDKIVETYHFPFSEALSFSILIWTVWGFLESFFWQKALPYFDPTAGRAHHFIYITSFLIYAGVATLVAVLMYSATKWILFTMDRHETPKFRSITLCLILGLFYLAAIPFVFQQHLAGSAIPRLWIYGITGAMAVTALITLYFLYHKAADQGFRIRRSGTTMMSVLVLSVVLSFVSFPIFSSDSDREPPSQSLKISTFKLMIMHYIFDRPPQS